MNSATTVSACCGWLMTNADTICTKCGKKSAPTHSPTETVRRDRKWTIRVSVPKDWHLPSFAGSLKGFFPKLKVISITEAL